MLKDPVRDSLINMYTKLVRFLETERPTLIKENSKSDSIKQKFCLAIAYFYFKRLLLITLLATHKLLHIHQGFTKTLEVDNLPLPQKPQGVNEVDNFPFP